MLQDATPFYATSVFCTGDTGSRTLWAVLKKVWRISVREFVRLLALKAIVIGSLPYEQRKRTDFLRRRCVCRGSAGPVESLDKNIPKRQTFRSTAGSRQIVFDIRSAVPLLKHKACFPNPELFRN